MLEEDKLWYPFCQYQRPGKNTEYVLCVTDPWRAGRLRSVNELFKLDAKASRGARIITRLISIGLGEL